MTGFDLRAWAWLFGPAGLPADVVRRLDDAVREIMGAPVMRDRLVGLGFDLFYRPPAGTAEFVVADMERWGGLVRDAGIQPE